ncbi:MAG: hypothetical protein HZB85_02790 [Deltaproteobacteria bacterium]|nr:hypothetical protein [Deltaproteobacteria bacterium]
MDRQGVGIGPCANSFNYIPVRLAGSDDIIGCEVRARLAGYDEKGMTADDKVIVKG